MKQNKVTGTSCWSKSKRVVIIVLAIACLNQLAHAEEARVVLRSTVTGNQEQPKVLYIVPWQLAENSALSYQPLQSLVEDIFETTDRDEFLRELRYRKKISTNLKKTANEIPKVGP